LLTIETRPLDRLIPYVRNARTHSPEQVAQIAGSIAEFGFVNPVLIGPDDVIVAGHGRVLAAQRLGLVDVPVIVLAHSRRRSAAPSLSRTTASPRTPAGTKTCCAPNLPRCARTL